MSPALLLLVSLLVVAQLALPRILAVLPLAIAAAHVGDSEILPQLTPARILILVGLARAFAGGYFSDLTFSKLDKVVIVFSAVALASSLGHVPDQYFPSPFAARAGLVLNVVGTYVYGRAFLPDRDAFLRYATLLPLILLPLALGMVAEQTTGKNAYFALGARSAEAMARLDKTRAQGPFDHPILAGTCGATALPFAFLLWARGRRAAAMVAGSICLAIVLSCASSGPLAAFGVSVAAVGLWKHRWMMKWILYGGVTIAVFYTLTRGRGPWFLMASLDLVGGSTGWHRAELIDQAYNYLGEWWLCGTDYTRHWMASGVRWNPNMVDLTNYYIHLGVTGGIFLTLSLVALIVVAFRRLVAAFGMTEDDEVRLLLWCAGASLAAHVISFVSISYFDQMYVFFYLLVGAVPGLFQSVEELAEEEEEDEGFEEAMPRFHPG